MALNFNVDPYYDDFDETKNFHRILFKPGYAVQARELTQSQTILQDQVSKFGLGVYNDGSKVTGGNIFIDTSITTAKLESSNNISSFSGLYAVGETSGLIASVIETDDINYYIVTKPLNNGNLSSFESGETINFYNTILEAYGSLNSSVTPEYTATLKTTSTVTRNASGTYLSDVLTVSSADLSVGDTLYISSIDFRASITQIIDINTIRLNFILPNDLTNVSTEFTKEVSVFALRVGVDNGVWFTSGFFVSNQADYIIPNNLSSYPSVVVGFSVDETIIDSYNDASLLDPAVGASNYQAPGADRYKISLSLTTKPYVDEQTVADLTTNKFIELVRINRGVVESIVNTPSFSEISKSIAQSVYDQSGNFIVKPFSLNIANTPSSSANTASFISAGKCYINGYPVEHIAPTTFYLEKARDYESDSDVNILTYFGNYVTANNIRGSIIDFQSGANVALHNVISTAASTSNKIGEARIRSFNYSGGSGANTKYDLYLFDIGITSNTQTFANVRSLVSTTAPFYANVDITTTGSAELVDSNYDSLIFPMPQQNIKDISNVTYAFRKRHAITNFASGITSIQTGGANEDFFGSGSLSQSIREQYYAAVVTGTSGGYTSGQFIPMANATISVTNYSGSAGVATINIGGSYSSSGVIYSTIEVSGDAIKVKTLNTGTAVQVSANTLGTPIDLGKSDIYNFRGIYELGNTRYYLGSWNSGTSYVANTAVLYSNSVYVATNSSTNVIPSGNTSYWSVLTNATSNYITDNGQRDAYYDHGYITNKSGSSKGNVVVVFDYFTHTGGIGYFCKNSYGIDYADIPTFTSRQYGTSYNLRDVLDFRPRRTDGIGVTTFDTFQLPAPISNALVDYSYYLSRIDKIVLYPNGQFKKIRGISSYINPIEPIDIPDALTIFTLSFPAYTFSKNDIIVTPSNLRRYTMRDIGYLDKRITNLEYYTTLSMLENQVSGSDVFDSTGENILFKNGFLVDSFKGQGVGDVNNPDYATSVDFTAKLARPLFISNTTTYNVDTTQGVFNSTVSKTNNKLYLKDNLVMFSYNEVPFITQNVASDIVNINPFQVSNFVGEFKLSPASDTWYATDVKPNVNIVNEDQAAWIAAVNNTGNGTQWNDWNINWTGQNVVTNNDQGEISRDTLAIQNAITQKGLVGSLTGGDIQVSSTTQVISNAIIPYCRETKVRFELHGMTPGAELFTFINGELSDQYVAPDPGSTDGVWYIKVLNGGTGYTNGNDNPNIITFSGNSTTTAKANANVVGGVITSVEVTQVGEGYTTPPTISAVGGTTPATFEITNNGLIGAKLVANKYGSANGYIYIPNNDLAQVQTGTVRIEFSSEPDLDVNAGCYARGNWYSQGTLQTLQTTVVSTRPPSYGVKPPPPPARPPQPEPASTVSWTDDPLKPNASSLSYQEVYDSTYNYLKLRALTPGTPITVKQVDKFFNNNGFYLIYTQLNTTYNIPPKVGATAGYCLRSIQYDASNPTVNSLQAINRTKNLIIKQAKNRNYNYTVTDNILSNALKSKNIFAALGEVTCLSGVDPIAQNFYVSGQDYPNGIFVSSINLFFATKDEVLPVNVRIRPTVNGYPDYNNDIPGSIVYMNPDNINVPTTSGTNYYPNDDAYDKYNSTLRNGIGPSTKFTFDHPVYLKPGEYSIMIASNSKYYRTYISGVNEQIFGSPTNSTAIATPTYAGSFFRSQNATTWVPSSAGETLCFTLNRCDFAGGTVSFDATATPTSNVYYDLLQVMSNDLSFTNGDKIEYQVLTKQLGSVSSPTAMSVVVNDNINFTSRQQLTANGELIIRPTLTNVNRFTSPVVDLERLNTILVQNIISPYIDSANTISESLGGFGNGTASGKYITRRVTLNNNFDSTDLTVYVDVNRPPGTSIEVYYKVQNAVDQNNFDSLPYVKMNPIFVPGAGNVVSNTAVNSWTSDTYQATNITYTDITTGTVYNNFKVFAIKVVFYSGNPAYVPQIKNFRTVATIGKQ